MKVLNRNQLKFIAICGMVCDHTAWAFLDFLSPLAQFMHIIGRLTIPIMCFFIAEGFRHTTSIRRYFGRLVCFWIVSIIPFYLFFHETFGYRQNIIFDLLLGLSMLTILEHKKLCKWKKILICILIFCASLIIGGWPILPLLYILIFYYAPTFKKQAIWFCTTTIVFVALLTVLLYCNSIWHFSSYDWQWYERLYLLGFLIPIPLLSRYNGQKGRMIGGRFFFYAFYPVHLLCLYMLQRMLFHFSLYEIYSVFHFLAFVACLLILLKVASSKPSRAQVGTLLFITFASIYTFGFLVECTSSTIEGYFAAIKIQYFGECLLVICFTWCIAEFCHRHVPSYIYAFEIFWSVISMYSIFTYPESNFFYTHIGVNYAGPFPRVDLSHGPGFYLFLLYFAVFSIYAISMCLQTMKGCEIVERKRLSCIVCSVCSPWIPAILRALGLTGGYEIPALGIVGTAFFMMLAFGKYGYFDSVSLAGENALNHGTEGILVIDNHKRILYFNKQMEYLFPEIFQYQDVHMVSHMDDIFDNKLKNLEIKGHIYEMRVDSLLESNHIQGYMLWAFDVTEHHNLLMKVTDSAKKDSLTGVENRGFFQSELNAYIANKGKGSLFMMDLDNFKSVNDTYGHQTGDHVLILIGKIIQQYTMENCIACRIGGDEFCLFFKGITDHAYLSAFAEKIIKDFQTALSATSLLGITTVSIGIASVNPDLDNMQINFDDLYNAADKALYLAKNSGKSTYHFYNQ